MAPLASAYIRLRTDSSALAGDVRRDATRAGTTGGTVMGREFGSAFRRVSRTLIGLGIGTFAVEAGRFAIGMADKFELSRARLETVTKNLGGDFNTIDKQVQALDNRLAAFGFTNADVEGSVASLESATKSSTKAMADAALAADIARGRNISLESATQILMRVETGHVAMLSRLGIATKDANGHLLTQQEALRQLAQLYGGSASHFAGTFAGKQQALRAELGNTAAEIGVALLPAAVDLAKVLQHDVLPPLEKSVEFFDRNRKTIEPLVSWVLKLTLAYKGMRLAQKALGAFSAAKVGVGAVGAAEGAFSLAHPLPVFVVNNVKGAGLPTGVAKTAEADAEAAAKKGFGAKVSGAFNSQTAKALIVPAVGYAVYKAMRSNLERGGIGIPGLFQIGGPQKNAGPEGNLSPAFRKQVDALGGIDKALAYYRKLNLAASWSDKTLAEGSDTATRSLKDQAKALAYTQTKGLALSQGQDDLRQAIHNMAVTVGQQSSTALKGNSDAAIANRDALRGAVSQAESYLQVLKQHHASATAVTTAQKALATAIKRSADNTYGDKNAVHDLLRQLGFLPAQIDAVTASLVNMAQAWNPITGSEHGGLSDFNLGSNKATLAAENAGKNLGSHVTKGYTPVVSQGVADATSKAFDTAKSKMQSDLQAITGLFKQTKQQLVSGFATLDTSLATDTLGGSFNKMTSVHSQLKADAAKMHQFAHLWHRLDDMNLDPRLLAQFAGPDYIPAMREILRSGAKGIRRDNRLERSIARDAAGVARQTTTDRYGQLIHHDLDTLPRKIARQLSDELQHKLHITVDLKDTARHRGRRVRSKS